MAASRTHNPPPGDSNSLPRIPRSHCPLPGDSNSLPRLPGQISSLKAQVQGNGGSQGGRGSTSGTAPRQTSEDSFLSAVADDYVRLGSMHNKSPVSISSQLKTDVFGNPAKSRTPSASQLLKSAKQNLKPTLLLTKSRTSSGRSTPDGPSSPVLLLPDGDRTPPSLADGYTTDSRDGVEVETSGSAFRVVPGIPGIPPKKRAQGRPLGVSKVVEPGYSSDDGESDFGSEPDFPSRNTAHHDERFHPSRPSPPTRRQQSDLPCKRSAVKDPASSRRTNGEKNTLKLPSDGKSQGERGGRGSERDGEGGGELSLDEVTRLQVGGLDPRPSGRRIERAVSTHQRGPFKYELRDFTLQKALGQGAFAKVYLVQRNQDGRRFALKSMRKDNVIKMQQVQHVQNERSLMESIRNPFLVALEATFQDSKHIYMIIEYMPGGDLFSQIQKYGNFDEPLAKFYASEVAMALSYLHSENIVYRDLKPENVLIDAEGHVKLGDFGFAKVIDGTTRTFCGTPSYIPPEILLNREYTGAVDWWSFGVLLFEMLSGCSPFQEDTAARTYERILQGVIRWPRDRTKYFSPAAESLIVSLLVFNPHQRLGCEDEAEIRDHKFFSTISWQKVKTRKQPAVKHANAHNIPHQRSATVGGTFETDADMAASTQFEISAWKSSSVTARPPSTIFSPDLFKDF